ncbi:MAG: SRPBCC family protein [Anaerolineales bacterium]|jgi:ligand-binding SRPBCC domain-containing protein
MDFKSQFTVHAPIDAVRSFHQSAGSLHSITPPLVPMTSLDAPEVLSEGDMMAFTLWMGPIPVRWTARVEQIHSQGFTDRQVSGPFETWVHKHSFTPIDESSTLVEDHVSYQFKSNPFWRLVGGSMALGLPLLFRYRAYQTRKILERATRQNGK